MCLWAPISVYEPGHRYYPSGEQSQSETLLVRELNSLTKPSRRVETGILTTANCYEVSRVRTVLTRPVTGLKFERCTLVPLLKCRQSGLVTCFLVLC